MKILSASLLISMLAFASCASKTTTVPTRTVASVDDMKVVHFPKRTAQWLLKSMDSDAFEGHGSPGAERYGYVHCTETYSDPGNHTSGVASCKLSSKENSSRGTKFPTKSAGWLLVSMEDTEEFEGHGSPNADLKGFVHCWESYSDPGNHSSGTTSCVATPKAQK